MERQATDQTDRSGLAATESGSAATHSDAARDRLSPLPKPRAGPSRTPPAAESVSSPRELAFAATALLDSRVLHENLAAFTEVTGLPVTVRDAQGNFFGSPTSIPRWCGLLRKSDFGFSGCQQSTIANAPSETGRVQEFVCHGALRHFVATVAVEHQIVAVFTAGPFVELPLGDSVVEAEAALQGIAPEALLASRRDVKWLPAPRARAAARLLAATATTFSRLAKEALENSRLLRAARPTSRRAGHSLDRSPNVLVAESNAAERRRLVDTLEAAGITTDQASTATELLAAIDAAVPSLIVIGSDSALPGAGAPLLDSVRLCQSIRQVVDVPIVVVARPLADAPASSARASGRAAGSSAAELIESFADDYIARPCSDRELVARIRRVLRRGQQAADLSEEEPLATGGRLTMQLGKRVVTIDGREVRLTPIECRLLACLARRANHQVASEQLLRDGWPDGDGDLSELWVHIRALRRKIEPDPDSPRYLLTRRGAGYLLAV